MRKWQTIKEYEDIKFDFFEGIAKITICLLYTSDAADE